jgi:hypothetical protein
VGFFAMDDTEIKIVGEFFGVESFFIVLHEIGYVGVGCDFGQVGFIFSFLQVMFGTVVLIVFAEGFFLL